MKKHYFILSGLLIVLMVFGAQANAASMKDVIGSYSMKYVDKVWLQGEGNDVDTNYGSLKIKRSKKFTAIENDDGKRNKYTGKCRVKGNKLLISKTKSLRNQIEKKALKPWLKEYVRDEGASISKIKFKYTKYKITRARIKGEGPISLKIILQGTVSGKFTGKGNVKRKFKYQSTVIFLNRI